MNDQKQGTVRGETSKLRWSDRLVCAHLTAREKRAVVSNVVWLRCQIAPQGEKPPAMSNVRTALGVYKMEDNKS